MKKIRTVICRLDDELHDQVEQYRRRAQEAEPWVRYTMSSAVRRLLSQALSADTGKG